MKDTFVGNMERGFARGIGTIVAYGIALLALTYLVKPQPQQTAQLAPQSASSAPCCQTPFA